MQALFGAIVALVVLNLYASQPLVGMIAAAFALNDAATGYVTSATLLGYGTGLLAIVPLADRLENRRLAVVTLSVNIASLLLCAAAPTYAWLVGASFAAGATSSAIQILVLLVASLCVESRRGQVIGNVMGGLMVGILLSRPLASFVGGALGWRAFYVVAATASASALLALVLCAPERRPEGGVRLSDLFASLWTLVREEPVLRRSALRQGACMAAFNMFWTSVALRLAGEPFVLTPTGIAGFSLAGAAGAVAAPLAGLAGDRGRGRVIQALACCGVVVACLLAGAAGFVEAGQTDMWPGAMLGLLCASAVLLDFCVIADQTLGRRAVNLIRPEARGRLNGLYTGLFFVGSAVGAALSGAVLAAGGWGAVCMAGATFGILALLACARDPTERRQCGPERSRPHGASVRLGPSSKQ
ncbi:MFS transporter [Arenibaculum pallidiluteum]|uniref:MFS transporter n=1 Tax=Arenibaculum pallidiluteum TaxID=2812559 RepID=UPI001A958189|nr:MFS transporter [Arenibaculum pallidiluteum]